MKPLVIANWKANPPTLAKAVELFNSVEKGIGDIKNIEIVICPPFIYLPVLCNRCSETLRLGAQDCFWETGGAYTGEISAAMLKDLCAEYVILGHSERRIFLKEQNNIINKKIKLVLKTGLKAILCVGGKSRNLKEIAAQIKLGLKGLNPVRDSSLNGVKKELPNLSDLIVAYEPTYAISTMDGKALSPEEATVGMLSVRKNLNQIFGKERASKIRILYGGSVTSQNAKDFILKSGVSGLLIGKSSLNPEEFLEIVKNLSKNLTF